MKTITTKIITKPTGRPLKLQDQKTNPEPKRGFALHMGPTWVWAAPAMLPWGTLKG